MRVGARAWPSWRDPRDLLDAPGPRLPLRASLDAAAAPRALVVGIGQPAGGDDSAGVRVARLVRDAVPAGVRVMECTASLAALPDAWTGLPLVILVETTRSGAPPGTISRIELLPGASPAFAGQLGGDTPSVHGGGLDRVIGRGRALGRLPKRLVIIGIEGGACDLPAPSSEDVRLSVRTAALGVLTELLSD